MRLFTLAASALVLGFVGPVWAQTSTSTTATTQTQAPAPAQTAPVQPMAHRHRHYQHSAQWDADHSANQLNREELARIESNQPTYGASH